MWADDEIDLLKPHVLFLEEQGYEVTPVHSGEDAIHEVRNGEFNLVLLDEMMDGMDGLQTLQEIKAVNLALPIIMITKNEEEWLMDEAIAAHMKRTYNLMIGEQTAERIKIEIGSAAPLEQEMTMEVRGRDMISGLPRKTMISSEEVREALKEPVGSIIDCVTRCLEQAEPELAADLVDRGVALAGGGALLRGMDTVLTNATGLDVRVVDDPLTAVARGTAVYLENIKLWKDTMESGEDDF